MKEEKKNSLRTERGLQTKRKKEDKTTTSVPLPAKIQLLVQLRGDGRVPRVQGSTRPVRNRIEVRVGLGGELGLAALDEGRARGGVDLFFFFFFFERERRERDQGGRG